MVNLARTVHLIDDRRVGGVMRFLEQLSELRPDDMTDFVDRGTMRGHRHNAGIIVSHLAISWRTLPMLITLRGCNPHARLVHVEHTYSAQFEKHRVDPRKAKRFHTLLRTVYALFDEVVAVSRGQAQWMSDLGIIPNGKVEVATPLIDLSPFLELPEPVPGAALRYGFVGRLDDQSGLDILIPAFREHAPAASQLHIYGDGPTETDLIALAQGDPSIVFHGRPQFRAEVYLDFDIAVVPSKWEPYGLPCLEAQAAGRPVLVADVDGLPEQVAKGAGRAVTNTPEAWATAFENPMSANEIAACTASARSIAQQHSATSHARWMSFLNQDRIQEGKRTALSAG